MKPPLTMLSIVTGRTESYIRGPQHENVVQFIRNALNKSQICHLTNGWSIKVNERTLQHAQFDLMLNGLTATHCWVCLRDTSAKGVWKKMLDSKPILIAPAIRPPVLAPWILISMSIDIVKLFMSSASPGRMIEAVALEASTAWALMPD